MGDYCVLRCIYKNTDDFTCRTFKLTQCVVKAKTISKFCDTLVFKFAVEENFV